MPSIIDIILYITLSLFVAYEIKEESNDLFSSKDKDHPKSEHFGDGCGKFVHWNKYTVGDTFENIHLKTQKLNNTELELPVWRRSILVAFIITIVIMIVIHKKVLSFPKFSLYFLILFFMFYYSFNYYHYHFFKPLINVKNNNLEKMNEKYTKLKKILLKQKHSSYKKENQKKK